MADEAIIITLLGDKGDVVRYACDDNVAIAKGAICFIDTDGVRLSGAALVSNPVAGIASTEKVAGDGQLSLGLYTYGIFDLAVGAGGCSAGDMLIVSGSNHVIRPIDQGGHLSGQIIGKALEEGTAETEVIAVKVNC